MTYKNLLVEKGNQTGIIKINRPEVRNALNNQTVTEILSALEDLENDKEIGIIIFTGVGEKAFAAGADINQLTTRTSLEAFKTGSMTEVYRRIENSKKATIAAINGFALGGGCELAMSCDIRMASDNAKFGLPELNLSVIPGAGGTQRLTRIIGKGRAMNMILTGEFISASEAKAIGLVSDVVPLEGLMDAVREKAERILTKGPLAIQMAKLVVNRGFEVDMDSGLLIETLAQAFLYGTEDKVEGTKAFLEKRQATFSGS
ncbi:enoyl-CoA hydratase/isomerase family protein [Niallia endozanthoxylica]|uniref:Enoyl-CoA hydratase/isomerase family protein n=1 Tax=Niallia endozanthoxylica TaxID=2036016 RepID=A0A5J5HP13_9BACI|nr:enoyl-CoA hydratase-related protein [Niallia endozanthoxylica]KAA9022554.1 enoyl-CoA hydratase/isomerase family protein [Niallia endozanthoxylica]